jgi:transposase
MSNKYFKYISVLKDDKFKILQESDIYNKNLYINPLYLTILNRYVDILDKITFLKRKNKRGRKVKYDNNLYFIQVLNYVLETGVPWNKLISEVSMSTIYRKYIFWCKNDVFQKTYKLLLKFYIKYQYLNYSDLHNLYIDATHVKNVNGQENIGKNHYDRFFNGTKLSFIVTKNKIPIGIAYDGSNISDITLVEDSIKNSFIELKNCKIIGDKGYNSKKIEEKLKNEKNIKLLPIKKNKRRTKNEIKQKKKKEPVKIKYNKIEKDLFNKRHKVENFISRLKACKKLRLRFEKKIKTYINFVYFFFSKYLSKTSLIKRDLKITPKIYKSLDRSIKKSFLK